MHEIFTRGIAEAARLTLAGRLAEATALIQTILGGRDERAGGSRSGDRQRDKGRPIEATAILLTSDDNTSPTEAAKSSVLDTITAVVRKGDLKQLFEKLGPLAKPELGRKHRSGGEGLPSPPSPAPGDFISGSFSNAAGARAYKLYVPTTRKSGPRPLIVMLHGCTQTPDDFAAGTRMNACAEDHECFVVYPEQTAAANPSKCWNWFNSAEQQRGRGEPSIIAGLTLDVMKNHRIDPRRVYVAGLSAGGAAAAVLGETYTDVYAAVGVHSGLACGAARDMTSAFRAMGGHGPATKHQKKNRNELKILPTIVFHGDRDATVHPRNGAEVIARAHGSANLKSLKKSGATNGRSFTRSVHRDLQGHTVMEEWVIHGAGHAWSGGSLSGSFTDPKGPDASREMLRFFLAQVSVTGAQND